MQHLLYFRFAGVDVMVYGKLVAQRPGVLAQQAVVVERAYQVFHYLALLGVEVYVHHLLAQPVVERHLVAIGALLVVGTLAVVHRRQHGLGHLVVHAYARQRLVEG